MFLFLLISFIILVSLVMFKAYKNTQNIIVRNVKIDHNETESVTSLNILHLSDLHLENISISAELLYEKLKNEAIDLIALTGDFLDRKRTIQSLFLI